MSPGLFLAITPEKSHLHVPQSAETHTAQQSWSLSSCFHWRFLVVPPLRHRRRPSKRSHLAVGCSTKNHQLWRPGSQQKILTAVIQRAGVTFIFYQRVIRGRYRRTHPEKTAHIYTLFSYTLPSAVHSRQNEAQKGAIGLLGCETHQTPDITSILLHVLSDTYRVIRAPAAGIQIMLSIHVENTGKTTGNRQRYKRS